MKVNFNDEVNWNHFVEVVAPSLPMRHIRDATLELIENKQYALIVAIELCYNDDPDNMKDHGELSHINFVNIYGEKYEGPLEILIDGKWIDGEFE